MLLIQKWFHGRVQNAWMHFFLKYRELLKYYFSSVFFRVWRCLASCWDAVWDSNSLCLDQCSWGGGGFAWHKDNCPHITHWLLHQVQKSNSWHCCLTIHAGIYFSVVSEQKHFRKPPWFLCMLAVPLIFRRDSELAIRRQNKSSGQKRPERGTSISL